MAMKMLKIYERLIEENKAKIGGSK